MGDSKYVNLLDDNVPKYTPTQLITRTIYTRMDRFIALETSSEAFFHPPNGSDEHFAIID